MTTKSQTIIDFENKITQFNNDLKKVIDNNNKQQIFKQMIPRLEQIITNYNILKDQNASLQSEKANSNMILNSQLEPLNKQIIELQKQLEASELQKQLEETEFQKRIEELNNKNTDLDMTIKTKNDLFNTQLEALGNQNKALGNNLLELDKQNTALNNQNKALDNQNTALNITIKTKNEAFNKQNDTFNKQLEVLDRKVKADMNIQLNKQKELFNIQIEELNNKIKELNIQIKELNTQLIESNAKLIALNKQNSELTEKNEELDLEKSFLQSEIASTTSKIRNEFSDKIKELENKINQLEKEKQDTIDTLNKLEDDNNDTDIEDLLTQLSTNTPISKYKPQIENIIEPSSSDEDDETDQNNLKNIIGQINQNQNQNTRKNTRQKVTVEDDSEEVSRVIKPKRPETSRFPLQITIKCISCSYITQNVFDGNYIWNAIDTKYIKQNNNNLFQPKFKYNTRENRWEILNNSNKLIAISDSNNFNITQNNNWTILEPDFSFKKGDKFSLEIKPIFTSPLISSSTTSKGGKSKTRKIKQNKREKKTKIIKSMKRRQINAYKIKSRRRVLR